jgi:hypothetical protein
MCRSRRAPRGCTRGEGASPGARPSKKHSGRLAAARAVRGPRQAQGRARSTRVASRLHARRGRLARRAAKPEALGRLAAARAVKAPRQAHSRARSTRVAVAARLKRRRADGARDRPASIRSRISRYPRSPVRRCPRNRGGHSASSSDVAKLRCSGFTDSTPRDARKRWRPARTPQPVRGRSSCRDCSVAAVRCARPRDRSRVPGAATRRGLGSQIARRPSGRPGPRCTRSARDARRQCRAAWRAQAPRPQSGRPRVPRCFGARKRPRRRFRALALPSGRTLRRPTAPGGRRRPRGSRVLVSPTSDRARAHSSNAR